MARATRPRRFKYVNPSFCLFALLLVGYGLIVQFSATSADADYSFARQLSGVAVGMVLFVLITRMDYHALSGYTTLFLIINIVLLLSPHLPGIGVEVNGGRSWINIGTQIQPGEFAKITMVLFGCFGYGALRWPAYRFAGVPESAWHHGGALHLRNDSARLRHGLGVLGYCCFCSDYWRCRLALHGGDGSCRRCPMRCNLDYRPIADQIAGHDVLLKDYQKSRLMVFSDSTYDTSGDGYNSQQAKIAIGSGGLLGKGFMQATQSSMGFLPEAPTDFVFCILAEEFGFVGALVLLAFYIGLIVVSVNVARGAGDLFGTIIVICIVGMWLFQILENIGMDCGLMPITGIPLPFISYGSSFMVVNFVMLGLINSVWVHSGR